MIEVLTRKEVAEFLKMPLGTVDYLVRTNQIPFNRLGKRGVRFDKGEVVKWFIDRANVEYRHEKAKN